MGEEFKIISICKPPSNSLDCHYFVSKFSGDFKFDKNTGATIERENNLKEFKAAYDIDTMPKTGAGSEYGREEREEARRRRYGIKARNYNPTEQPFILRAMKKDKKSKKYKGVKNSGVLQNTSYIVLLDQGDHMDVLPVNEFYEFNPVIKHKVFNEAEVEELYKKRGKTVNYFALKQNNKNGGGLDEEDCDLKDKESCDYMSASDNDDDDKKKGRKQRRRKSENEFDEEEQDELVDEALDDNYNKPSFDYCSDFSSDEEDDGIFGDFEDSDEDTGDKSPNVNNDDDDDDDDEDFEGEGEKSKLSDDSDSESSSEDSKEPEGQSKLPTSNSAGTSTVVDRKRKSDILNEPAVKKPKVENELEQKVRQLLSKGSIGMKEFTDKIKVAVPKLDSKDIVTVMKKIGAKHDNVSHTIYLPK